MSRRSALVIFVIAVVASFSIYGNSDFPCFYNAANSVIHGQSPYENGFYNPLWTTLLFVPYTLFPLVIATKIHVVVSILVLSFVVIKLAGSRKGNAIYAIAGVFIVLSALIGNIELLPLLGLILPAPIGIWFILTKPQLGLLVAGVMILEMIKERGWKWTAFYVFPVVILGSLSFLMGMWNSTPIAQPGVNYSLFPYGIIVGIPIGLWSLYKQNRIGALTAMALITPYLTFVSYIAFVPAISEVFILLYRAAPEIHLAPLKIIRFDNSESL